jgi:transposase
MIANTLLKSEAEEISSWLRSGKTPQSKVVRGRIILLRMQRGMSISKIATMLEVDRRTVRKWIHRFDVRRLAGLEDLPRSGRPPKVTVAATRRVLKLTTERRPREANHWSTRLMSRYSKMTKWRVGQIWKAANLKPHRLKTFKISKDPLFAQKLIDIVALYTSPPRGAVVLSVDEKTQIQALDRTQPMLPMRPGQIERRTHDYKRNGVLNLYAALDIVTGKVIGRVTKKHRAVEFIAFLKQLNRAFGGRKVIHLIIDNSSTHKTPAVRSYLQDNPRFQLHFTPTSASWLNAVESWFSQLERRTLYRGVFKSVADLGATLRHHIKVYNTSCAKPFRWTKSAETILKAVDRARTALTATLENSPLPSPLPA